MTWSLLEYAIEDGARVFPGRHQMADPGLGLGAELIGPAEIGTVFHGGAVVLPQVLTIFHEYEQALLGLIVMVFMIFLRRGIVPSIVAAFAGRRK